MTRPSTLPTLPSRQLAAGCLLALLPGIALAHPGHADNAWLAGMLHPLSGVDHLLAMLLLGWWAWARKNTSGVGQSLSLPCLFVAGMLGGAGIAQALPLVTDLIELILALSLVVLGIQLLQPNRLRTPSALLLAAGIGGCHGYAHGGSLAMAGEPGLWLIGMLLSTLTLHLLGFALARRIQARTWARPFAAGFAAGSGALLVGLALA